MYGSVDANFLFAFAHWLQGCPNMHVEPNIGDSHVDRARNTLCAKFLASDCDELLFMDCDILATPDHINRLRSHSEPVVGGVYYIKSEGEPRAVVNASLPACPVRADGMQRHKYIGTGFMLIKRRVFEIMIDRLAEKLWYTPDSSPPGTVQHNFFGSGIYTYQNGGRRWLSEDWMFCQLCENLGIDVWADTTIVAPHRGQVNFPLQSQLADTRYFRSVPQPQQVSATQPPPPIAPAAPPLSGAPQGSVVRMAEGFPDTAAPQPRWSGELAVIEKPQPAAP
jgi:hypothetical protein